MTADKEEASGPNHYCVPVDPQTMPLARVDSDVAGSAAARSGLPSLPARASAVLVVAAVAAAAATTPM